METILLAARAPFSFAECLWFLDRQSNDCMHVLGQGSVTKALGLGGRPLLVRVRGNEEGLQAEVLKGRATPARLTAYLADWFDLDRDLRPFYRLLRAHPGLSYMARDFKGLRLMGMPDMFEAICWCIIGQQINLAFAHKVKRSMVERYGTPIRYEDVPHYLFPTPEVLAEARIEDLKALQFSRGKAEYVIATARAFAEGSMSRDRIGALAGFEARQEALMTLKGVGEWTANYVLMKTFREPASIPYADAGLLNALLHHEATSHKGDRKALDKLFGAFPGWESYLVFYLWRSLAPTTSRRER